MRFLGVGDHCDLGDMYLRLAAAGHEVRVLINEPEAHDMLAGLVTRADDAATALDWVGRDGVIVFETAHDGAWQDELRRDGYKVIGGGAFGDRLEGERAFGQDVLRDMGLPTATVTRFTSFDDAIAYAQRVRRRLVFKMNGKGYGPWRNYVGQTSDGSDIVPFLAAHKRRWTFEETPDFVLMDFVDGVEIGVGAYFDGRQFLRPACLDWEHKRFFNGDLGELTGEMGTLVTYSGTDAFFERTLAKVAPLLRDNGYVGYINLNTIVNADGIWPLEFTCRFGYPGFAILDPLQRDGWAPILTAMAFRTEPPRFTAHPGFALGVVLTLPPFPYRFGYAELSRGTPILLHQLSAEERDQLHYGEVALDAHGDLVAAGSVGYILVVTGRGDTAEAARAAAYATARKVSCPNVRYRTDIGERFIARDRDRLRDWGLFTSSP